MRMSEVSEVVPMTSEAAERIAALQVACEVYKSRALAAETGLQRLRELLQEYRMSGTFPTYSQLAAIAEGWPTQRD